MILVWGGLAGGTIAWVWGAVSWMLLPWNHATFLSFSNEDDVARFVTANCPRSGLYGLPGPPRPGPGATKAERESLDRAAHARMTTGPIATIIVQRDGFGSVPMAMVRAFAIYAASGAALTWLLLQTTGLSYWHRVSVVAVIGLAAGVMCRLTDWTWQGYPASYTLVGVTDQVMGAG